jgi:hypothetical protein
MTALTSCWCGAWRGGGEVSAARDHAEACEVLFRRSFMHPLRANRAYDHLADVAHGEQTSLH